MWRCVAVAPGSASSACRCDTGRSVEGVRHQTSKMPCLHYDVSSLGTGVSRFWTREIDVRHNVLCVSLQVRNWAQALLDVTFRVENEMVERGFEDTALFHEVPAPPHSPSGTESFQQPSLQRGLPNSPLNAKPRTQSPRTQPSTDNNVIIELAAWSDCHLNSERIPEPQGLGVGSEAQP